MKPLFQKVPIKLENSLSIHHDVKPNFGGIWHYHPELELRYIIRGEGVRFIGDNISNFSHGEIVLVGENLPHIWHCKEAYFQHDPDWKVEEVVIQFLPDFLGKGLLNLPEAYLLPKLYERAKKGLIIFGETRERLTHLLKAIAQSKNLERIALMVSILHTLAESTEYEAISQEQAFYQSNETDTIRLNKVCDYTLSNYKKDITLEEISAISNLSITSFCRYFKLMTKKTYYDFLIEIRISHACRALVEDKVPTEVICFDSGFNNVSNFYRHFKKVTGITPLEYKRKYHTK